MAFDDILTAITQETDRRIADAKDTHKKRLSELREQSEQRLLDKKRDIDEQCREKKQQMRAKAATHIDLQQRNSVLLKKQELLERFYKEVEKELCAQKPAVIEGLLKKCLDDIRGKGEIRPAKPHKDILAAILDGDRFTMKQPIDASGGFVFVSDSQEFDFTFANMIENQLRPRTEVAVSHALFH